MLRKMIDSMRKLYAEPGSRFHKIWPAFDAFETFLFAPGHRAPKTGPHVRDYIDLKRTMNLVIVALLPCLLWAIWNAGYQHFTAVQNMVVGGAPSPYPGTLGWLQGLVFGGDYLGAGSGATLEQVGHVDYVVFGLQKMIPILIVSYGVGLGIEFIFCLIRKEEVSEGYLVSGMLIALIVPTSIPLWQLAVAIAFSVVLAKEVFGGTGMNIFNPALMVRAFLFFAFPAQMSGDSAWVGGNAHMGLIDGYSAPTALAVAAYAKLDGNHLPSEGLGELPDTAVEALQQAGYGWWDLFWGFVPGSAGEMSAFCVLLGAGLLLATGVASWRTILAGVLGLVAMSLVMMVFAGSLDGIAGLPPHYHLVAGGFAFGIVYMATDPVSSPETHTGRWIYGFLIGVLTVLIRAVNPAYPEGVMLAILLLNAFAPTIDHFVVAANVRRRRARLA